MTLARADPLPNGNGVAANFDDSRAGFKKHINGAA